MASLSITTRITRAGERRYAVRYRLGGRSYPVEHGGTFKTMKDARARRDLIAGELSAGRNPAILLRALTTPIVTPEIVTVSEWGERFVTSRIDIDQNTAKNYRSGIKKISDTFGDRDPAAITAAEIAEWVAALAETRKPGTLQQYLIAFRLLLDHAAVDPNPARDPRVKLPKRVREEPSPPPAEHVLAILAEIHDPLRRLLFVTIEQGALRLGEAVGLRWGDVEATAPSASLGDEARQGSLGLPARVADRGDRADLPARGQDTGAESLPGDHRGHRVPDDAPGLPDRRHPALSPARPPSPQDHRLASVGCPGARARGAGRPLETVDVARCVLARHARRRDPGGQVPEPDPLTRCRM